MQIRPHACITHTSKRELAPYSKHTADSPTCIARHPGGMLALVSCNRNAIRQLVSSRRPGTSTHPPLASGHTTLRADTHSNGSSPGVKGGQTQTTTYGVVGGM